MRQEDCFGFLRRLPEAARFFRGDFFAPVPASLGFVGEDFGLRPRFFAGFAGSAPPFSGGRSGNPSASR